jgi:hypothetical protein
MSIARHHNEWLSLVENSAHMPMPDDTELGWRTFLAGIEYVDGKPYLMTLVHFDWEP